MTRTRLLIFARAPVPGRCKTRLARRVGHRAAARVQQQLIAQILHVATLIPALDVELWCEPSPAHVVFWRARLRQRLRLRRQWGRTLGSRMLRGLRSAQNAGIPGIVVGTDCPGLDQHTLQAAQDALRHAALVLTPALDGGYVLIASRVAEARLFQGIQWGSAHVLTATRQRARGLRMTTTELPPLPDLDHFGDWWRARRRGEIPPLFRQVGPGIAR